jgi:hypothetical protein
MYCTQCGAENAEGNKICSKCGAALIVTASPTATAQPALVTQKTSGFAIASLVLGIISIIGLLLFLFSLLFSVPAIICGSIAISHISKNTGLKGKGLAIAGLVLSIMSVIICVILGIWVGVSISRYF